MTMGRAAAERADRARALGTYDLVLSHLTVPRVGFEERVAAAAGAGFAGIGLNFGGWKRLRREGWTVAALADVLDRHDQLLVEIEFLQAWGGPPALADRAAEEEALAFELAEGLGARHLQLGGPFQGTVDGFDADVDRLAEALAGVCDRAAEHGLLVSLEYLPEMTTVGSVSDAVEVVTRADRPNGGVCVDSWHHERGPDTLDVLAAIDGARIASVQIDDGSATRTEADYQTDTSTNRLAPGDGDFDLVGMLRTLSTLGVDAPLGVEVISPTIAARPTAVIAERLAAGCRRVLAEAFPEREAGSHPQ
jgi:sugar phosphate isomerase/epimerase